ncbi:unnamed protein product [Clonostachys rosea]|uniref:DUF4139 domain-containing protein n=1 Tax=Bionectria ochroleuca TaxID=29856 RepID=A0ABY6U1K3_BIOOC|nr:unnamed protein product [Clonostachys rosea]
MESISKAEYNVRNLKTRSVTLFPSRAQICRELKDIPLHPGTNEITIIGLSPTVDEQSIKVEGSGSAIISDIAVESLPNRDIFEDIYPEFEQDKTKETEDDVSESDEEPEFLESPELQAAKNHVKDLLDLYKAAEESERAAEKRQASLDSTTVTLNWESKVDVEETMDSVSRARDKLATRRIEAARRQRELSQPLAKARQQADRLDKLHRREKARATQEAKRIRLAKTKAKLQESRREEERLKEKARKRKECEKFWPKYCYAVRIQLVANAFTPTASRRGSVSSDVDMVVELASPDVNEQPRTIDLVLSYVTTSAHWSPSYDLQLSTTNATGLLCFDAQIHNTTSETWDKCKITLSTSLAAFSGLDETMPPLVPWHLELAPTSKKAAAAADDNAVLYSKEEKMYKAKPLSSWGKKNPTSVEKSRSEMFGTSSAPVLPPMASMNLAHNQMAISQAQYQQNLQLQAQRAQQLAQQQQAQQQQAQQQLAQRQQQQQQQQQQMQIPMQQMQQKQQQMPQRNIQTFLNQPAGESTVPLSPEAGSTTSTEDLQQLDFQESLVEEMGFSTSYDLPGLKTLAPKSNPSKQRVARLNFSNIHLCHTIVPKYRSAAYLSAKMLNSSKLTLLRGQVGVTLDGSFMGRTTLPKCGCGQNINLSLGVDPAIRVGYSAPEMKRATSGFFTKEDIKLYERTIRVENTRTTVEAPVKLIVSDQVPLSKNENLRVELLKPEGLVVGAESQPAGEPGKDNDESWGSAKAHLRKTGTVDWLVALQPGKSVKLSLEYLVATPIGNHAKQA